jgi:hypothetical protein
MNRELERARKDLARTIGLAKHFGFTIPNPP